MFDTFYESKPLNVLILKTEFEESCGYLLDSLDIIYEDFKKLIQNEKIDFVEALGGIIRIPMVLEKAKNIL